MKIYCVKHPNNPMQYNGEARGPLYVCMSCGSEIEVVKEEGELISEFP